MHHNFEEALLSPVASPAVTSDPVFYTVLRHSPSYNSNLVINLWPCLILLKNSPSVRLEFCRCVDAAANGAVFVDLSLHAVDTGYRSVLLDVV